MKQRFAKEEGKLRKKALQHLDRLQTRCAEEGFAICSGTPGTCALEAILKGTLPEGWNPKITALPQWKAYRQAVCNHHIFNVDFFESKRGKKGVNTYGLIEYKFMHLEYVPDVESCAMEAEKKQKNRASEGALVYETHDDRYTVYQSGTSQPTSPRQSCSDGTAPTMPSDTQQPRRTWSVGTKARMPRDVRRMDNLRRRYDATTLGEALQFGRVHNINTQSVEGLQRALDRIGAEMLACQVIEIPDESDEDDVTIVKVTTPPPSFVPEYAKHAVYQGVPIRK